MDKEWIEKKEVVGGVEYKYSSSWLGKLENVDHWKLYWKQQQMIESILRENIRILEVGVGTGFTANYLKSGGHTVTTIDIDADKKPDIVANIVNEDIPGEYDLMLAYEVFEHIPYDEFMNVIDRMKKANVEYLSISVPVALRKVFSLDVKLPRIKRKSMKYHVKKKKLWDYHFWEIGYEGTTMEGLSDDLKKRGYKVVKSDEFMLRQFIVAELIA